MDKFDQTSKVIFLTHFHTDHLEGYTAESVVEKPIPVFASPLCIDLMEAAAQKTKKRSPLSSAFRMVSLQEGDSVVFSNLDQYSVSAEPEVHRVLQSNQITSSHEIIWTDGVVNHARDIDQNDWIYHFPCRVVVVTAIPAYHCEGSVLFYFELFCGEM